MKISDILAKAEADFADAPQKFGHTQAALGYISEWLASLARDGMHFELEPVGTVKALTTPSEPPAPAKPSAKSSS